MTKFVLAIRPSPLAQQKLARNLPFDICRMGAKRSEVFQTV
jgi:hypothetical protein